MIASPDASIHASAVAVGKHAVLIRGASGSGKSRLAFDLILAGRAGILKTASLVGDDRVQDPYCLRCQPNSGRRSV